MGVTKVIGHRGASGYLPENTIESMQLAFEMGADAVEFDVVPTRDQQLIIRHEPELSKTTNISALPEFESRKRDETINGEQLQGWFSQDYSSREILELRAIERFPNRVESAEHDGKYLIPTLGDLLATPELFGKHLVIELKHPDYYLELGLDLPLMLQRELLIAQMDPEADHQFTIESFDWNGLLRAKELIGPIANYVFLAEPATTPDDMQMFIDAVADNFDGISLALPQFLERFDIEGIAENHVLDMAKAKGLYVFTYTARVEQAVDVPRDFEFLANLGFDGVFADQPDVFRSFVKGWI